MKTFHKAPLALAIAALMVAPYAMADRDRGGHNTFDTDSKIDSDFNNDIDVELNHDSDTYKNLYVTVGVWDPASNYSGATVDSKQLNNRNVTVNKFSENNATLGGNAARGSGPEEGTGEGSSGNIGINVAAGDNNQQANDAALAVSDANNVFGQAAAFSAQSASKNGTMNMGSPNNATLTGSALRGATGNIGVNVSAGTNNAQQNSLAAASFTGTGSADATTGGVQAAYSNMSTNMGKKETLWSGSYSREDISLGGGYVGVGFGGYQGEWKQTNDVYPEIWIDGGDGHPGGDQNVGHLDFDNDPDQTSANSQFEGEEGGTLGFIEVGKIGLSGHSSGFTKEWEQVLIYHENNATLNGNALRGASGNIGVNVAAGNNNLQRNSLAIAASSGEGVSVE